MKVATMSKKKNSLQQQAIDLLRAAMGEPHAHPLMLFVRLLGSHQAAWFLNQLLYWADRTSDPEGWFYRSLQDWQQEDHLSRYQIERALYGDPRSTAPQVRLSELGIETCVRRTPNGTPVKHYRVNHAVFCEKLGELVNGDLPPCSTSTCDNAAHGLAAESQIDLPQSNETRSTQIVTKILETEINTESSIADDDVEKFKAYEGHFGRLKETTIVGLRAEVERLGESRAGEVLQRCTKRGRSWAYVLAALTNETVSMSEDAVSENTRVLLDQMLTHLEELERPIATERILERCVEQHGWTAETSWQTVYHQLEMQLDRSTFDTFLRGAQLMDYDREQDAFIVLVRTGYARETCQLRLIRLITRVLKAVCGRPMEARFVTAEEWRGQGRVEAVA
jgi:hypothetical protein